jgi:hypothetical protein
VVGRLWRVFKIIEEFSSGAEDEMADMQERLEELERDRDRVIKENQELRYRTRFVNGVDGGGDASNTASGG